MILLHRLQKHYKLIIFIDLLLFSLVGFLPALFFDNYTAILVLRILLGLFCGISEPFSLSLINKNNFEPSFFGYRATAMSFISLIFNLCGGLMVDKICWYSLFYVYLIGILLGILVLFTNN